MDFFGFGGALATRALEHLKNNPQKLEELAVHLIDEGLDLLAKRAAAKREPKP